jgi:hypothetical protein
MYVVAFFPDKWLSAAMFICFAPYWVVNGSVQFALARQVKSDDLQLVLDFCVLIFSYRFCSQARLHLA